MAETRVPMQQMQGVAVPATSVNAREFFLKTRRMMLRQSTQTFPGYGATLNLPMLQTGIIGGLCIKFSGTLTVTLGGGTAATTMRWPYGLFKALRFAANGQSNLVNCGGAHLKAREIMQRGDLTDRGVARGIGGASPGTSRTQGTLSLANEDWGVGQNVTAIPGAPTNYPVELALYMPLAMDKVDLIGAIFAQTSSTDLSLAIDFAPIADLFTLTGAATAALTGTLVIEAETYTIPMGGDGQIVVPDLNVFHSIIQNRVAAIINGTNEVKLPGQGIGRSLQRMWFQVFNGTTPAPLALNATNFGQLGWRYGGNDTPEAWQDGKSLAYWDERLFGADFASQQGIGIMDWCSEHAFRDAIDEGAATELRAIIEIPSGVSLTSAFVELTQETLFPGAVGA